MILEEKRYLVYVDDESHPIILNIRRSTPCKDDSLITEWVQNTYEHSDFKYYDLDSLEKHTIYLAKDVL